MRTIEPRATASITHDGYLLRPCAVGVAVAGPMHAATLFDGALTKKGALVAAGTIEDIAWSASGRLAALIDDDGLHALEPSLRTLRWRVVGKSYACHFSVDSEALWVARPAAVGVVAGDRPGAWIELRDAGNGAVLARRYLEDPFGGAAFTLAPHPDPRGIVVWLAAADGASRSIVVTARGRELTAQALPVEAGYPPELVPDSSCYLLARDSRLERRRWSDHAVQEEMEWPWLDDAPLAVLPLGARLAIWASQAGRLHLVDHVDMTYLEEVAIAGREPAPMLDEHGDESPTRWGTPLAQLCAAAGHVILQFGERELVSVELSAFEVP